MSRKRAEGKRRNRKIIAARQHHRHQLRPSLTYKPNGDRECERRRRQMAEGRLRP